MNVGTESGGSASLTSNSTLGVAMALGTAAQGSYGVLNLDSGTLATAGPIYMQGSGTSTVNLNGATIQPTTSGVTLINTTLSSVNVYKYGAIFNIPANTTGTVSASLLAASGSGVYPSSGTLAVSSGTGGGGSGYIGAPLVAVAGGSGSGAMAIAQISNGAVTGVTLTNPGQNYQVGDVLTFNFAGGGATAAATPFQYTLTANEVASNVGGLTLTGPGLLQLSGQNTYAGGTIVTNGTLQVGNQSALGVGGLTVNNGTVDLNGFSPSVTTLSGSTGTITTSVGGLATLTASPSSSVTSTFAGAIEDGAGQMALVLNGPGELILSGTDNTYSGGTIVEAGTLIATNNEAIEDGTALYVGSVPSPLFGGVVPAQAGGAHAVPEPGTLALLAVGALVAGFGAWRRRKGD
jgi:autotransporter-associated beta strand protein